MFMVLMLHANFVALGKPTVEDLNTSIVNTSFRWFVEAFSIASVNAFVLISGWFGIKASLRGTLKFIYQILFFLGGSFLIAFALGKVESPVHALADVFQLTTYDWFIKSYFVLIIISPLLNQFRQLDVTVQKNVLLSFFTFEAIVGWAAGGSRFFVSGYGPLHLMGMYLLGQYLHYMLPETKQHNWFERILHKLLNLSSGWNMLLFLFLVVLIAIQGIMDLKFLNGNWSNTILAYSSPFVVIASVFLFLSFERMNIRANKVINWLGASSFAVYLIHGDPIARYGLFIPIIQNIKESYSGISVYVLVLCFLFAVFLIACIIDQIRIITWNKLSKRIS